MRTRLAVTFTLVAMFASASASTVLEAQRGGGGAQIGAGNMGGGGMRSGGGARNGGAGGGGARSGGGRGNRGGGFRNPGRVNMPPALPSINRPSFPIDGLNRPSFPLSGPLGQPTRHLGARAKAQGARGGRNLAARSPPRRAPQRSGLRSEPGGAAPG